MRFCSLLITLVLLAVFCFAAAPVATVSSTQALVVSGISVPTNRLMSWPVSANDEIATQAAPAVVRFTDGTVVTLQRNSRMRLDPGPAGVEVKMLAGSAIYDLKSRSSVSFGPALARTGISSEAPLSVPACAGSRSANEVTAEALMYRMPATAPRSGIVLAPTAISTGQFLPAAGRQEITTPGMGNKIILPNGIILEVSPVSGAPGQYTISRVLVPVTDASGQLTYASTVSSPLIGAGVAVANAGTATQQITIFNGGVPLTPDQANQQLQNAAQNAVSNAPGTTPRPTGPITVDPVSPAR